MAIRGRDGELELFLDSAPGEAAAGRINRAFSATTGVLASVASGFDRAFGGAFSAIAQRSAATARQIQNDAQQAESKLKTIGSGFKDFALGSFAGGLSSTAATSALQQIVGFAQDAGRAFLEGDRAATFLENTTKRLNLQLSESKAQVQSLRSNYALLQTDAEKGLAIAIRAASLAGDPSKGGALFKATLNLTEQAGLTKDRVPDFLQQIATGQDAVFEQLFGVNPSFYYDEWAKSVGRTAASMTDLEKAQVRVMVTLREGGKAQLDHEKFAESAAGKWERIATAVASVKRDAGDIVVKGAGTLADDVARGFERVTSFRFDKDPTPAELAAIAEQNLKDQQEYQKRVNAPAEAAERVRQQQQQALRDIQTGLAYAEAQREARDEGPFAEIRRRTKAEVDRILKAETQNGQLTGAGARQVALAQWFGQSDEAKRALDINKQLAAQLDELSSKYAGEQNPLVRIISAGRQEAIALREQLAKLGPDFSAQAQVIEAEAARLRQLSFFQGLAGNVSGVSAIDARIASLQPRYARMRFLGRYGQVTDDFHIAESFAAETEAERAARAIGDADEIRKQILAANGPADVADRIAREALLQSLGGLSPSAIGADPNVRDRYLRELEAEKKAKLEDRRLALEQIKQQQEKAPLEKQNLELMNGFLQTLKDRGIDGAKIVSALQALANPKVGVDLNVTSDRQFDATVEDGTAIDRVTAA